MNSSMFTFASAGIVATSHDLLYLAAAGAFLLIGLHHLVRMIALAGPIGRIFSAAAMVALSVGAALILLLAIMVGAR